MSTPAFIYDAIRTPRGIGKKNGALHEVKPVDLLAGLLRELQQRNNLDTSLVDDVVMGCCNPIGEQGSNVGKAAVMVAGWDESVPAVQIDRFCASGVDTSAIAATRIMSGWEDLIVAGGVECMSRVPLLSNGTALVEDPATAKSTSSVPQGLGADLIATIEGFSREDVDAFAVTSQQKADKAQKNGYFDNSVIPVKDANGMTILEKDEYIRPETTVASLSRLKASFEFIGSLGFDEVALSQYPHLEKINHVHHAGNSSGIVDGASALLFGSEKIGEKLGLTPRGRMVSTALVSTESTIMLTGPAPATRKALKLAGLTVDQIDLFEINEAFASVAMLFQKELGIPWEKINVNGSAIALGHPLGATGGVLIGTVLDELERQNLRYGVCTLCAGAGIGIATVIERVS